MIEQTQNIQPQPNIRGNKIYINLNQILQINNYHESLCKWIKNFHSFDHKTTLNQNLSPEQSIKTLYSQAIQLNFDKYLRTIKPVIHNFSQLTEHLNREKYGFYTEELTEKQLNQVILRVYDSLNSFQIITKQQIQNGLRFEKIDNNIQQLQQQLLEEGNKQSQQVIWKMDLMKPPQNKQIKFWMHTVPINKFVIEGVVVQGKGIGKEQLGMPTANVQIPKQTHPTLSTYPNGIYITSVTIDNQTFIGASSLGTNPHYQNEQFERILQVYILNNFGEQKIYGKRLKVQFYELIRLEFKFSSFDAFLNGMRNDIEVCKGFKLIQTMIASNNELVNNNHIQQIIGGQ